MNKELDWPRIAHLMKLGIAAAVMVPAGDMLLKLFPETPLRNALTAGWISVGNLWMFGGLLAVMKKAKGGSGNEE